MEAAMKMATEQGLAFLIGIGVVAVIQPTTTGGAILLILIIIAAANVINSAVRASLKWKRERPITSQNKGDVDLTGSG